MTRIQNSLGLGLALLTALSLTAIYGVAPLEAQPPGEVVIVQADKQLRQIGVEGGSIETSKMLSLLSATSTFQEMWVVPGTDREALFQAVLVPCCGEAAAGQRMVVSRPFRLQPLESLSLDRTSLYPQTDVFAETVEIPRGGVVELEGGSAFASAVDRHSGSTSGLESLLSRTDACPNGKCTGVLILVVPVDPASGKMILGKNGFLDGTRGLFIVGQNGFGP